MQAPPSSTGWRRRAHGANRDLLGAWLSLLLLLAVLGVMPFVPALSNALGFDVEESFGRAVLALIPVVVLVLLVATATVVFGLRSRRNGGNAGLVPAVIAGVIGGGFLLLQVAAIVGHLLGLE